MSPFEYPVSADGCRRVEARDPQAEVLFLVREAVSNIAHAITTSERREDFAGLLTALLALKCAEETVRR